MTSRSSVRRIDRPDSAHPVMGGHPHAGKLRVLIAGNIYAKFALVRRFLEDDGYEVVGVARTKQDVIHAVQERRPDAVVIDEDWIDQSLVGTILRIRAAQPGAKIVVFTSGPPIRRTAPKGADGYLEKGAGLAILTSMLARLFAGPDAPIDAIATGRGRGCRRCGHGARRRGGRSPRRGRDGPGGRRDASLEPARFASRRHGGRASR